MQMLLRKAFRSNNCNCIMTYVNEGLFLKRWHLLILWRFLFRFYKCFYFLTFMSYLLYASSIRKTRLAFCVAEVIPDLRWNQAWSITLNPNIFLLILRCPIKRRMFKQNKAIALLVPNLPRVMKERARKAAPILMKNSQFDRTIRYYLGLFWIFLVLKGP